MKGKNKKLNEMLQQKGVNSQKSWSKQIYIHVHYFFLEEIEQFFLCQDDEIEREQK